MLLNLKNKENRNNSCHIIQRVQCATRQYCVCVSACVCMCTCAVCVCDVYACVWCIHVCVRCVCVFNAFNIITKNRVGIIQVFWAKEGYSKGGPRAGFPLPPEHSHGGSLQGCLGKAKHHLILFIQSLAFPKQRQHLDTLVHEELSSCEPLLDTSANQTMNPPKQVKDGNATEY